MSERWINAVIEVLVPLDVPLDASNNEKQMAVALATEDLIDNGVDDRHSIASTWELVEDGEPVPRGDSKR